MIVIKKKLLNVERVTVLELKTILNELRTKQEEEEEEDEEAELFAEQSNFENILLQVFETSSKLSRTHRDHCLLCIQIINELTEDQKEVGIKYQEKYSICCSVLIASLKTFKINNKRQPDYEYMNETFRCIRYLARNDKNKTTFQILGACELVLSLYRKYYCEDIAASACSAICNLANNSQNQIIFGFHGCDIVLRTLEEFMNFTKSSDIIYQACGALYNLSINSQNCDYIATHPRYRVYDILIHILNQITDENDDGDLVLQECCICISQLSFEHVLMNEEFGRRRVAELLVNKTSNKRSNPLVMESFSECVVNLSYMNNESSRIWKEELDIYHILVEILNEFPTNKQIVTNCSLAFFNLRDASREIDDETPIHFMESGIVQAILKCLHVNNNGNNTEIANCLYRMLVNLCEIRNRSFQMFQFIQDEPQTIISELLRRTATSPQFSGSIRQFRLYVKLSQSKWYKTVLFLIFVMDSKHAIRKCPFKLLPSEFKHLLVQALPVDPWVNGYLFNPSTSAF